MTVSESGKVAEGRIAVICGRCVLAPTLCDRYRASLHDPQVAGSPVCRIQNNTPLVEWVEVWRGVELRSLVVGASVHRQPLVPLHRATALCGCLYASLHNDFV